MPKVFPLALLALLATVAMALDRPGDPPIFFENPSFEGKTEANACPPGWSASGPDNTPDTQPGPFNVQSPDAKDGLTYVGLVVREDGSHESIGQKLSQKLVEGKCYTFSVWLAHTDNYGGHKMPCRLKVRGGPTAGGCGQVLGQSGLIDKMEWTEVKIQFTAASEIEYIVFEAEYAPGAMFKYKGNILLDNLSAITRCDRA